LEVDEHTIEAAVTAANRLDLWQPLVHLAVAAGDLPRQLQEKLGEIVNQQPKPTIERFEAAAAGLGHPNLLDRLLQGASRT
jgi:hypothetical protein